MKIIKKMHLFEKFFYFLIVANNCVMIKCAPPPASNSTTPTGKTSPKLKNYDIWGQSSEHHRSTSKMSIIDNEIFVIENNNKNVTGNRNGKGNGK